MIWRSLQQRRADTAAPPTRAFVDLADLNHGQIPGASGVPRMLIQGFARPLEDMELDGRAST
jgi:hypothetical protein